LKQRSTAAAAQRSEGGQLSWLPDKKKFGNFKDEEIYLLN
jgi:hypothetical protein